MINTHATPAVAELTRSGGALDLGHDKARLRVRMVRLLALGPPVTRDHALNEAAESGIDRAQAERWAAGRDDIVILSIEDGFAAARDMADALSGYEPETPR